MLPIFVACNKDDGAAEETETVETVVEEATEKTVVLSQNGKSVYTVVVPSTSGTDLRDAAQSLVAKIAKETGVIVKMTDDATYAGNVVDGEYEILVGATNRAESSEVSEGLAREEFRVKWVGNKLVIGAGSNFSAKAGFEWLYENYIKTAGSDGIFVPENIDHKGSVDMNTSFEGLKSGWNSLVYPASDGTELKYQLYMPANYDKNKEYPCILYMHSAGVRCDDNSHIYTGEAKFLRNFESSKYAKEAIIVAPCCPKTEKWVPAATWNAITYDFINTAPATYMKATTELFADARAALSIDESRLYLYGMSMGAFATWDLLTRNPDMFAAAIPVAGAGDPNAAATFGKTAIWIFHGTADASVPFESGQKMYDALVAAGRTDIKFTKFDGAGHGIWAMTADTSGLFDWLFAQKLG